LFSHVDRQGARRLRCTRCTQWRSNAVLDEIRLVPFKEFLVHCWVAARTIDKVVARLDQGVALTPRRDAYFSIVRATTRRTSDDEIGSSALLVAADSAAQTLGLPALRLAD
jgi:hypothetical protein